MAANLVVSFTRKCNLTAGTVKPRLAITRSESE